MYNYWLPHLGFKHAGLWQLWFVINFLHIKRAVMNLRFREMRGISGLAANQLASQEGLCTIE